MNQAEPVNPAPGTMAIEDTLRQAIETEQGILLTPFDPTVQEALALASEAARQFQPALRELAQ
jgi:hypothetical protein